MFRSKLFKLGQLCAVALFTLSCGEYQSPTTPAIAETADTPPMPDSGATGFDNGEWIVVPPSTDPGGRQVRGIRWNSSRVLEELSVSGTIDPAGGILAIPRSDFVIVFPQGAVESPTRITIISKESPWVTYDMQPHGLVFAKPIYAMQGLANTTAYGTPAASRLFGAYLAPGTEMIAPDNTATAAETTLSYVFQDRNGVATWSMWVLNHFSRYILASG